MEAKIYDPETGKDITEAGVPGEFCVRGYNIMKGYYKLEEATKAAIDSNGWLHTGDLATVDKDGYYKITGRIKDMIIRGGENLFPKEIEDFILHHEAVRDVAVVAIPSQRYGEEACAYVILKDGAVCDEETIQKYVNKSLAKHKVPSHVLFVDKFPLTASGKIQKFLLRDQAIKELHLEKYTNIETA
jgi:fatty-acyl-CoA synthase